ncbi:MAG: DinB family protein [Acidobacteria bacterium]|nr:DinB family protein [Acidobacteriota bacterium]
MNADFYILRLSQNAKTIESLVSGLCDEQINWKSAPEQWSISHIVYHLWRTEEKDFRSRLEKTLRDPQEEWTPLSPQEMRLLLLLPAPPMSSNICPKNFRLA